MDSLWFIVKFYQQFLYDKKSNKRKIIKGINLVIYGVFILIPLNGNLAIITKDLFKWIEGMKKKQIEINGLNLIEKNILLEFIFRYYIS